MPIHLPLVHATFSCLLLLHLWSIGPTTPYLAKFESNWVVCGKRIYSNKFILGSLQYGGIFIAYHQCRKGSVQRLSSKNDKQRLGRSSPHASRYGSGWLVWPLQKTPPKQPRGTGRKRHPSSANPQDKAGMKSPSCRYLWHSLVSLAHWNMNTRGCMWTKCSP